MATTVFKPIWDMKNGNGNEESYISGDLKAIYRKQIFFQKSYHGMWDIMGSYYEIISEQSNGFKSDAFGLLSENSRRLAKGECIEWANNIFGYKDPDVLKEMFSVHPVRNATYEGIKISDGGYAVMSQFHKQVVRATFGSISGELKGSESHQKEIIGFLEKEKDKKLPYQILDV